MFLSLDNPSDSTIDKLVAKFKNNYEQIYLVFQMFMQKIKIYLLFPNDSIQFKNDVLSSSDWIINNVNEKIKLTLENYIYRNGTNEELSHW